MKRFRYLKPAVLLLLLLIPLVYLLRLSIFPGFFAYRPDIIYGYTTHKAEFTATDGTALRGWFFNRGEGKPLVAIYTGNNMNIGSLLSLAVADPTRSYLMLNYRGYGDSAGIPSESRLVADALHNIDEARRRIGGVPTDLHIIGYSIGSGVATQVAAATQPATLSLICPFDCITEVACDFVPLLPRLLLPSAFDSAHYAASIHCPVTIIRATGDTLVTPPHTARLAHCFPTPPTEHALEADHNSIFTHSDFAPLLFRSLNSAHRAPSAERRE